MTHTDNAHNANLVINVVDDAVVANSNPPPGAAHKLYRTTGSRRIGKAPERARDLDKHVSPLKLLEVVFCGGLD